MMSIKRNNGSQLGRHQGSFSSSMASQGSRETLRRLQQVSVPSELHSQQPQGQTAAYQCWPPAKAAWASESRGMYSRPLPCLLSFVPGSGDLHKHQLLLTGHHIMLYLCSGVPRVWRIQRFYFGPVLAPCPVTGNCNSSWL